MRKARVGFKAGPLYGAPGHFGALLLPDLEIREHAYDKLEKFLKSHTK